MPGLLKRNPALTGCAVMVGSVAIFVVFFGFIFVPALQGDEKSTTGGGTPKTTKCNTLLYPPVNDEEGLGKAIDDYIAEKSGKSAPLYGLGHAAVLAGGKVGINPIYMINIARKESTFGKHVPPNSFNSFGRTATSSQPHIVYKGRKWYKSESWEASFTDEAEYLKRMYADKGKVTVREITYVYAPPGENDTEGYIAQMEGWMEEVIQKAGSSITCN